MLYMYIVYVWFGSTGIQFRTFFFQSFIQNKNTDLLNILIFLQTLDIERWHDVENVIDLE